MNLVRAFALIAVLLIHGLSGTVEHANANSSFYFLYVLINKMSIFAVPLFLFVSGFVLMYAYQHREANIATIATSYKRRMSNVIIPYMIFSVIYFAVTRDWTWSIDSLVNLGDRILFGNAYVHLYYIFVIFQFYLLFPLVWKFIYTRKSAALWIWLLGVIIQWGYFYFNREYLIYVEGLPKILERTGSLFVSYAAYFGCGLWVATKYGAIVRFLEKHIAWHRIFRIVLLIAWLAVGIYYAYINYRGMVYKDWQTSPHFAGTLFVYIMITIALCVIGAKYYEMKCPSWLQRPINSISDHSFGIYLIHPLLLYYYRDLPMSGNPIMFNLYFVGQFLFGLLGAWLITILISNYVPYAAYIVGKGRKIQRNKIEQESITVAK